MRTKYVLGPARMSNLPCPIQYPREMSVKRAWLREQWNFSLGLASSALWSSIARAVASVALSKSCVSRRTYRRSRGELIVEDIQISQAVNQLASILIQPS